MNLFQYRWGRILMRMGLVPLVFALLHVLCAFSSVPVFLASYVGVGLIGTWASLAFGRWIGYNLHPLREQVRLALRDVGWFTRWREQIGGWMVLAAGAVVWPVIMLRLPILLARYINSPAGFRLPPIETLRADHRLRPRVLFDSTAVLVGTITSYLLTLAEIGMDACSSCCMRYSSRLSC